MTLESLYYALDVRLPDLNKMIGIRLLVPGWKSPAQIKDFEGFTNFTLQGGDPEPFKMRKDSILLHVEPHSVIEFVFVRWI